jgi:hypothetical protein
MKSTPSKKARHCEGASEGSCEGNPWQSPPYEMQHGEAMKCKHSISGLPRSNTLPTLQLAMTVGILLGVQMTMKSKQ